MKLRYVGLLLVKTLLVTAAVVVLSFFMIHAVPGDAATVMAGQAGYADEAFMKNLRAEYGLDQPLSVQLWKYLGAGAHGDLAASYAGRQPARMWGARAGAAGDPGTAAQHNAAGRLCSGRGDCGRDLAWRYCGTK